MTELEKSRQELHYLFNWFYSRSADAEGIILVGKLSAENTRKLGGMIRDFERMTGKLRKEWDKFLKLNRKVNNQPERNQ